MNKMWLFLLTDEFVLRVFDPAASVFKQFMWNGFLGMHIYQLGKKYIQYSIQELI